MVVWIGYRAMIGPLEPEVADRLDALGLATTLPFMGAWIAGLVLLLSPNDRWLGAGDTRAAPTDGEDPTSELLRSARRAANRAPRRFATLWMVSWVVPQVLLNYLVLVAQGDTFQLGPETWVGVAFLVATLPLGARALAITFMSRFLGPTMGRLSPAVHARGFDADRGGWSLHWRTLPVALCLGFTPVLWIASITCVANARAEAEQGQLRAALPALRSDGHPHADRAAPAADQLGGALRVLTGSPFAMIGFSIFQRHEIGPLVEGTNAGIAPANLILNHGFTTKKNGNGFGLHRSASSAPVMRGSLTAFTLELPTGRSVPAAAAEDKSAA